MNTRDKINAMSLDELREATIPLVEYLSNGRDRVKFDETMALLRRFEPSPIDKARAALKASGFVNIQSGDPTDKWLIQLISSDGRELWRLTEGAKP